MFRALAVALVLASPGLAAAQGAKVSSAVELAQFADELKPGEWVWAPEIAPEGPVSVYVDLSRQLATVYRNGVRIGVTTVSSGKTGHETPTGVFVILQKDRNHHSDKYNDAPMPYQERLTWDGVALHAGGLPGYPESHGCVHLPMEFARLLFGTTTLGGTVVVAGKAGGATLAADAGVLAPAADAAPHQPLGADEPFRWTPEAAPTGPLTVVLSRFDERAIVLRDGIEIGRARADLPDDDFQTTVLTWSTASGPPRWISVGVPGDEAGDAPASDILAAARLPAQFLAALRAALVPGSTVLVTQAPVLPDAIGQKLTVLASEAR